MNRIIYQDDAHNAIRFSQIRQAEQETPFSGVGIKFVVSGEEQYFTNGRKFLVGEGEYLIGNDHTSTIVKIKQPFPVQGVCIDISPEIIREVADCHHLNEANLLDFLFSGQLLVNRYHISATALGSLLTGIYGQIKEGTIHKHLQHHELFYTLAEALIHDQRFVFRHLAKMDYRNHVTNEEVFRVLLQVKSLLDQHVSAQISLDEVALKAGISKYHMIRSFKKIFGISPYRYLLNKRLEHARLELIGGSSISEVAFRCGYPDVPSFSKAFRQLFSQTPGAVQKSNF